MPSALTEVEKWTYAIYNLLTFPKSTLFIAIRLYVGCFSFIHFCVIIIIINIIIIIIIIIIINYADCQQIQGMEADSIFFFYSYGKQSLPYYSIFGFLQYVVFLKQLFFFQPLSLLSLPFNGIKKKAVFLKICPNKISSCNKLTFPPFSIFSFLLQLQISPIS